MGGAVVMVVVERNLKPRQCLLPPHVRYRVGLHTPLWFRPVISYVVYLQCELVFVDLKVTVSHAGRKTFTTCCQQTSLYTWNREFYRFMVLLYGG